MVWGQGIKIKHAQGVVTLRHFIARSGKYEMVDFLLLSN